MTAPVIPQTITGKQFYLMIGDGASTEVFTYLGIATTIDSDHATEVEDAMVADQADPASIASRVSAVKGKSWDLSISGLADPKLWARVRTLYDLGSPGNFQLKKDLSGANGGSTEAGSFLVTSIKESMADRGLVKFSATLHGQGFSTVTAAS